MTQRHWAPDEDDEGEDLGAELLPDALEDDGFMTVYPGSGVND
jgi:hypothetical protein